MVLIGYWPLNEDSGSPAYDHSGNENHGSVTGAGPTGTGTVDGPLGQSAYDFDGSDDLIDLGTTNFGLSNNDKVTITAWVNYTSDGHVVSISNEDLCLTVGGRGVESGEYGVRTYDGTNVNVLDSGVTASSGWEFIALTYDGSAMRIFVSGTQENSASFGYETEGKTDGIGGDPQQNEINFGGEISEVRIYNHALTPSEVQYLYNVSKTGRQVSSSKQS